MEILQVRSFAFFGTRRTCNLTTIFPDNRSSHSPLSESWITTCAHRFVGSIAASVFTHLKVTRLNGALPEAVNIYTCRIVQLRVMTVEGGSALLPRAKYMVLNLRLKVYTSRR